MPTEHHNDIDWDRYRTELQRLYLTENRALDETANYMYEVYGLSATKSQYETQFRNWGFRKNVTKEGWMYIGRTLRKRKRDGKAESEVYFNGRLVPPKRVQKEVMRYYGPGDPRPFTAMNGVTPSSPEAITVQTPENSACGTLPPDDAARQEGQLSSSECSRNRPRRASLISHDDALASETGRFTMSALDVGSVLEQPPMVCILLDGLPWMQVQDMLLFREGMAAVSDILPTDAGCNTLTRLFGTRRDGDTDIDTSRFLSMMRTSSLERSDELQQVPESLSQLFKFALYLASNNLLSDSQVDGLLRWLTQQNLVKAILSYSQASTTDALAARILESAARNGDANLLYALKDLGIDTSPLKGLRGGRLLQLAVEHQNIEVALFLIESGAAVSLPPKREYGFPPLQLAVETGQVRLVEALLRAGANVNARSDIGHVPNALAKAVHGQDIAIVRMLIDAGVDVNACRVVLLGSLEWGPMPNSEIVQILYRATGMEPPPVSLDEILKAAGQGVQTLSELLSQKTDLTVPIDPDTDPAASEVVDTALYVSVENADYYTSATLLTAGADACVFRDDRHALSIAVDNCDLRLVQMLLEWGADLNNSSLLLGEEVSVDLLRLLLENGLDLEEYGGEALGSAACGSNHAAIKLLLASGVDIDAESDLHGFTALQAAALQGHLELVNELLRLGANVNAPPGSEFEPYTALQGAALGHPAVVRALLCAGADVNAPAAVKFFNCYSYPRTALGNAIFVQCAETVKILLDAGADVNASGTGTGLEAAVKVPSSKPQLYEIVEMLLAAGVDPNGTTPPSLHAPIVRAARDLGDFEIVKLLLRAGADINWPARGLRGRTVLQSAAEAGNTSMVKTLLQSGAHVNANPSSAYGRTALQAAASAENSQIELIEVLLAAGAEVNATPAKIGGITALQGAAIRGYMRIALILLEAGADADAAPADSEGRTALEGAAEHGRLDMVKMLLNALAMVGNTLSEKRIGRAIELAKHNAHPAVARLLEDHRLDPTTGNMRWWGPS